MKVGGRQVNVPVTWVNNVERCFGSSICCSDFEVESVKYTGTDGCLRSVLNYIDCPHMDVCKYYEKEYADGQ